MTPKAIISIKLNKHRESRRKFLFFVHKIHKSCNKDNGWRTGQEEKLWQKLNELWYHLILSNGKNKPHAVFHHTSICDKCFRTSSYELCANVSSYLLSILHHHPPQVEKVSLKIDDFYRQMNLTMLITKVLNIFSQITRFSFDAKVFSPWLSSFAFQSSFTELETSCAQIFLLPSNVHSAKRITQTFMVSTNSFT